MRGTRIGACVASEAAASHEVLVCRSREAEALRTDPQAKQDKDVSDAAI